MALTLLEAAKLKSGEDIRQAVIAIYAQSSDLLRVLPFEDIQGNALRYNQEEALPGIAFRGVNGSWTPSTGVINPVTEPLVIAGGELDVDPFIVKTMGDNQRAVQENMKIKAIAHNWTLKFFKGDSATTPAEFDGLQTRLVGNQLIADGSTSGGDALSLAKLDEAIDAVSEPTHLVMNKTMRRRLTVASRTTSVGGDLQWEKDEFGKQIAVYNGLPIIIADEDNTGAQILPFTEANPGGGSAASTSIYCLSLGEGKLQGIQNGIPEVTDLGEIASSPVLRTRVEWYCGITLWHSKAASRLWGIKDAAVVV